MNKSMLFLALFSIAIPSAQAADSTYEPSQVSVSSECLPDAMVVDAISDSDGSSDLDAADSGDSTTNRQEDVAPVDTSCPPSPPAAAAPPPATPPAAPAPVVIVGPTVKASDFGDINCYSYPQAKMDNCFVGYYGNVTHKVIAVRHCGYIKHSSLKRGSWGVSQGDFVGAAGNETRYGSTRWFVNVSTKNRGVMLRNPAPPETYGRITDCVWETAIPPSFALWKYRNFNNTETKHFRTKITFSLSKTTSPSKVPQSNVNPHGSFKASLKLANGQIVSIVRGGSNPKVIIE